MLLKPISAWKAKTGGGGGGSFAFLSMQNTNSGTAASTHDFTLASGEKYVVLVLAAEGDTLSSITTSDADTVTLRGSGYANPDATTGTARFADFTASSTGTVTLTVTMSSDGRRWVSLWRLPSTSWAYIAEATDTNVIGNPSVASMDINTNSGDIVLGGSTIDTADATATWSTSAGFDQVDADSFDLLDVAVASAASAVGVNPETFNLINSKAFKNGGGIVAVYRA